VGRAEDALEDVVREVEEEEIEHHGRAGADLLVAGEVHQREQRQHVLVVVDVGEPLAEAGSKAQVEPAPDAAVRHLALLAPRLPRVREAPVGEKLPGQERGAGEEDLMVLGPGAHRVRPGSSGQYLNPSTVRRARSRSSAGSPSPNW
jgi:hypothetical protein